MLSFLQAILLFIEAALAIVVGYLLFLTAMAWLPTRRTPARGQPATHRFAILIPAHNEERLLPSLLNNLQQLEYPRRLYTMHVVADNCSDRTAELARAGGAIAHERFDTTRLGKGYALEWLLERLWATGDEYDAVLIIDADSIVSPNFLAVMDARLARGEVAIQAYYAVRDADSSWSASLRSVALAALHYLRPLARTSIGGSAGLKGNGMVFSTAIIKQYHWPASLTEDIEYHMNLILGGERVSFAPDAIVWAEMPNTLAGSQTQNVRWERGRQEMVRHYVPRLLRTALARRSFLLFDAAIEQLIPPLSVVVSLGLVCLIASALLQSASSLWVSAALVFILVLYVLSALILARAPRRVYQSLLYAPFFITWKVLLYLRVLLGFDRNGWTRTARNDS